MTCQGCNALDLIEIRSAAYKKLDTAVNLLRTIEGIVSTSEDLHLLNPVSLASTIGHISDLLEESLPIMSNAIAGVKNAA